MVPGLVVAISVAAAAVINDAGAVHAECRGIWLCAGEAKALPAAGPAWDNLLSHADRPSPAPNLSDQDDQADVAVLAKALVYARTGRDAYRAEVVAACRAVMGTERHGRTLALARGLAAYVIAADLVGLPPALDGEFRAWLRQVRDLPLRGRTLRSTHKHRPNNWGLHAGASRLAVALYLGETAEIERVVEIFKGYLGDRRSYAGFRYGALDWQADPARPVGINPAGARRDGHDINGVLPDDQRRCCEAFVWPPPRENYVYEALQGALATAVMLDRAGHPDVWSWQDKALLRAFRWLHDVADYPAEGDDEWQTHVINDAYGTAFPAAVPAQPGKGIGFTDWTLGPRAVAR